MRDINAIRWKLEDEALTIIATQAPMAGDLRWIAACLHIVTDLERMADHAAGNAKIVTGNSGRTASEAIGGYSTHVRDCA